MVLYVISFKLYFYVYIYIKCVVKFECQLQYYLRSPQPSRTPGDTFTVFPLLSQSIIIKITNATILSKRKLNEITEIWVTKGVNYQQLNCQHALKLMHIRVSNTVLE